MLKNGSTIVRIPVFYVLCCLFYFEIVPLCVSACFSLAPVFYSLLSALIHSFPHLFFSCLSPPVPSSLIVCICSLFSFHVFVSSFCLICLLCVCPCPLVLLLCLPSCVSSSVSSRLALVCFWFLFLLFLH